MENKLIDQFILGEDYVKELRMNHQWVDRAISSGLRLGNKSVYTMTSEVGGEHIVYPTVRRKRDSSGNPINQLEQLTEEDALRFTLEKKDYIRAPSATSAEYISKGLSNYQKYRNTKETK
tara:strand:+ start:285 stop:644 length:360 start_codon:yes stop_codon:yes gene_type:complete